VSEIIKWGQLTPHQRNVLVAEKVMGWTPTLCVDGEHNIYMGAYWSCTCGWISDTPIVGGPAEHEEPVPRYSQSMDAAWQVLERFIETRIECLNGRAAGRYRVSIEEQGCWRATSDSAAEAICLAALSAVGVAIQP